MGQGESAEAVRCPWSGAGKATLEDFSFAQLETATNPFPYYSAMRAGDQVHFDPGTGFYWLLCCDDMRTAVRDSE